VHGFFTDVFCHITAEVEAHGGGKPLPARIIVVTGDLGLRR
jgi:hypothetical protein